MASGTCRDTEDRVRYCPDVAYAAVEKAVRMSETAAAPVAKKGLSQKATLGIVIVMFAIVLGGFALLGLNLTKTVETPWWISTIFMAGIPIVLYIFARASAPKRKKRAPRR